MEEAYRKAQVLIEALPYFKDYDKKIVVVKLGGNAMNESSLFSDTLQDIVFMKQVGLSPVLVHGGGPFISKNLEKAGIPHRFEEGLRVTTTEALQVVDDTLWKLNQEIADEITRLGGRATSVHGAKDHVLFAEKKLLPSRPEVDLQWVGNVTRVDPTHILELTQQGIVPVLTPLAAAELSTDSFNINADTAAAELAKSLKAEKLVFMSNIIGILRDENDPSSLLSTLTHDQAKTLIASGVIKGGMLPKVEAALQALEIGVKKVHIIDGRRHHTLLLEIFTQQGVGTQFIMESLS